MYAGGVVTSHALDLGRAQDALALERRIADMPADASIRGIFFFVMAAVLSARDPALAQTWRAAVRSERRWAFRLYPLADFLREQALAAALLCPDDPVEGVRTLWRATPDHAPLISAEKYGRMLLGGDPMRAFRWLADNRQLFCNYGHWHLEELGPRSLAMVFRDEYLWIAGAHRGGAEGSLRMCGVSGTVTPVLDTPYDGRLLISWA